GSTIDLQARDYVAYGNYGDHNLYRYALDTGIWRVSTIPFFAVNDGGIAWLPGLPGGIYFVQGEGGTGFAGLVSTIVRVTVTPSSGTVPPSGALDLAVRFDATRLPGGTITTDVIIDSNDPLTPEVRVPATLTVIAAPDLALSAASLDFGSPFVG